MSDRPTEVRRVDSSTPEGRLWNWLAGEWERVTQSNHRQAEAIGRVQALCASPEFMTSNHDCDAIEAVSVADLRAALAGDK